MLQRVDKHRGPSAVMNRRNGAEDSRKRELPPDWGPRAGHRGRKECTGRVRADQDRTCRVAAGKPAEERAGDRLRNEHDAEGKRGVQG